MYANLRTVDGETNHYLVPRTLPLTDAQDELVVILDTDDPALRVYIARDYSLTWQQLRVYLSDHPDTAHPLPARERHGGPRPRVRRPGPRPARSRCGRRSCSCSGRSTSSRRSAACPRSARLAR